MYAVALAIPTSNHDYSCLSLSIVEWESYPSFTSDEIGIKNAFPLSSDLNLWTWPIMDNLTFIGLKNLNLTYHFIHHRHNCSFFLHVDSRSVLLDPRDLRPMTLTCVTFHLYPCYLMIISNVPWHHIFGPTDQWTWPSGSAKVSPGYFPIPNFVTLCLTVLEIWIFVQQQTQSGAPEPTVQ